MGVFVGGRQITGIGEQALQSEASVGTAPPVPGKSLGRNIPGKAIATITRMTPAQLAAYQADQASICGSAARLMASKNPSGPGVAAQCFAVRRNNVMVGKYIADPYTPDDAAYRTALTAAGEAIVGRSAALQAQRAQVPNTDGSGAEQRGFTMAQGVRAGMVDPAFLSFVLPGLSSLTAKGFTDALAAPALTQAGNQGSDDDGGIPRNVLIAGGAVAVLAVAAVAFKLTRK